MKRVFLLICLVFSAPVIRAQQYSCVDSLSISPGFPCPSNEFYPVCGCNNVTYRNDCEAKLRHGVRTTTEGSCSGFEFDIIPTYDPYQIYFTLVQATPQFSRLFIVDSFGKLWWQKEISASPREYFSIDISYLSYGTYIIYVYDTKGTYRYKKFVRIPG